MLNREMQRQMLTIMKDHYPRSCFILTDTLGTEEEQFANLAYLDEHGLCESGIMIGADGHVALSDSRITARGLDFLEDDGGLSAILGTVTVKLHGDTIRDLMLAKVNEANLSDTEKSELGEQLRKLPAIALQAAVTDLVGIGLNSLPHAIPWLQRLCRVG